MDLAPNNLQKLICHKIQPTNQPAKSISPLTKIFISQHKSFILMKQIKHFNGFINYTKYKSS